MRFVREVTGPVIEPVTLAEARLWCRIDDDDTTQDAMLNLLIYAARERAEALTGRVFAQRALELRLDAFPEGDEPIELPYPPLQSVAYVTYATPDGDVTMGGSPDAFLVDTGSYPGRVSPLYGASWPGALARAGSVRIGYTCGHANSSSIPKSLRVWMQARIATLFEHREHLVMSNVVEIPEDFCDGLLDHLRVRTMLV